MKLNVIDNTKDLQSLRDYLKDEEIIAYDVETTGVHKGAEIIGVAFCTNELESYYTILAAWDASAERLTYLPGMKEAVTEIVGALKGKSLIMHNGIFDCSITEDYFKVSLIQSLHTDTMVLAHLLDENRLKGLKDLGKIYFGIDADKEKKEMDTSILANGGSTSKNNYELYKGNAYLVGRYGAKDALLTYKLLTVLVEELYAEGLEKFFYEEESMPLLRGPTYEMNRTGFKVNGEGLLQLKKQLEAECLEDRAFIYSEIAPYVKERYPGGKKKTSHFNVGSNAQLSWLLFGVLGQEYKTLTKGGKTIAKFLMNKLPYTAGAKREFVRLCLNSIGMPYSPAAIVNGKAKKAKLIKEPWSYITVDDKVLQDIAPKLKWVDRLLKYKKKQKLLSTYVCGIEERVQYGVIHPSYNQSGTVTGRYSSSKPNFQNLPKNDKRIKKIIVSRPGKVFVGADYSQLEPRIFAFYSKDERLQAAFAGPNDFYSTIGIEVFNKNDVTASKLELPDSFRVKYSSLRDVTKVIALSGPYGTLAPQLASKMKKSIDETQRILDEYFERFPKLLDMINYSHEFVKDKGYVVTHFGRKRRLPLATTIHKIYGNAKHAELPYVIRNLLNQAVNSPIQGTAGSIVNRAALGYVERREQSGIKNAPVVLQVHDQLVVECDEKDAENVSLLLQDAMENTTHLEGIGLEAIPKIGKNLGEL